MLLLGIEGLAVAAVEVDRDVGGRVVQVVTDDEGAAGCPECGVVSTSVKGQATTRLRDVPYGPDPLRLVWHKRRWRCRESRCPKGSFTESIPRMWNGLIDQGDIGIEILHAYAVKENLRQLLDLTPTPGTSVPDRPAISHRLWRFLDLAAASDDPEVHRYAATIQAWWPTVEASIPTGYSNARSEGYNRLAKHQGRNAFGLRNTANQRRRIRWFCTRQHRRVSTPISEVPGQVR